MYVTHSEIWISLLRIGIVCLPTFPFIARVGFLMQDHDNHAHLRPRWSVLLHRDLTSADAVRPSAPEWFGE